MNGNYGMTRSAESQQTAVVSDFMNKVYTMMGIGLGLTAFVSFLALQIPALFAFTMKTYLFLSIAQIGIVLYLSMRISKMNASTGMKWFFGYAALNGLTFAPLALVYSASTIAHAFLVTGLMFGAMAIYGVTTKKDLSQLGSICMMGFIGLFVASIVNMVMGLFGASTGAFGIWYSYAMVAVFTGITAWDAQKLRQMAYSGEGSGQIAVLGALQLYLNFIIMFIHVLRILGGRRD